MSERAAIAIGAGKAAPAPQRPMLPILTFSRRPLGREIVALGAEEIGEIQVRDGGFYAYRVTLHGVRSAFLRAESLSRARDAIERLVNDWLNRIGVFYPGLGVELRIEDGRE